MSDFEAIPKNEVAEMLKVHPTTLSRWLNELYYDELIKLSPPYKKNSKKLLPQHIKFLQGRV